MKLDDLSRPPRIHRYAWYLLLAVCAGSLAHAGWTERKNVELTHTNAELVARRMSLQPGSGALRLLPKGSE